MRHSLVVAALVVVGWSARGVAQEPPCRTVRTERGAEVHCREVQVHGRLPQASVLLGRSRYRYDLPPLERRDAAREVVRTVRREPF